MTDKDQLEELAYLIKDVWDQRCQFVSCDGCEFLNDSVCQEKLIAKYLLKHDYRRMSDGVVKAMEKQLPCRVNRIFSSSRRKGLGGYCPNCNGTVEYRKSILQLIKREDHCTWCGQSLDWSEGENHD